MSVALTGASSFTALWIARALSRAEFHVDAVLGSGQLGREGLRQQRVELISKVATLHGDVRAETGAMVTWILNRKPDFWIHHHHFMENYRSPEYDIAVSQKVGIAPLEGIVTALQKVKCKGIVYSGSYFEPGEGGKSNSAEVTPYGLSKGMVWEKLLELSQGAGIPIAKVVIPNPVGPLENSDRLIPFLLQKSNKGEPFQITNPDAIADNLPADALAAVYVSAIRQTLDGLSKVFRPSGVVLSTKDWVDSIVNELVIKRLGLNCPSIELRAQNSRTNPLRNPLDEKCEVDWSRFWDDYSRWIKSNDLPII